MKKKNSLYKAAAFLAIVLASTSCTDDANSLEESESQSKFVSITAGMNTTPTTGYDLVLSKSYVAGTRGNYRVRAVYTVNGETITTYSSTVTY